MEYELQLAKGVGHSPNYCRDLLARRLGDTHVDTYYDSKEAQRKLVSYWKFTFPLGESAIDLRRQVLSVSVDIIAPGLAASSGITKPDGKPKASESLVVTQKRLLGIDFLSTYKVASLYVEEVIQSPSGAPALREGVIFIRNQEEIEKVVFADRTAEDIEEKYATIEQSLTALRTREQTYHDYYYENPDSLNI